MKKAKQYELINTRYPQYISINKVIWVVKPGDYLKIDKQIEEVIEVIKKPIEGHMPEIKTKIVKKADEEMTEEMFNKIYKYWHIEKNKQKTKWELYRKLDRYQGDSAKVLDVSYPISAKTPDIVPDYILMRVMKS